MELGIELEDLPDEDLCKIVSEIRDRDVIKSLYNTNNRFRGIVRECVKIIEQGEDRPDPLPLSLVLNLPNLEYIDGSVMVNSIGDLMMIIDSLPNLKEANFHDESSVLKKASFPVKDAVVYFIQQFCGGYHHNINLNGNGSCSSIGKYNRTLLNRTFSFNKSIAILNGVLNVNYNGSNVHPFYIEVMSIINVLVEYHSFQGVYLDKSVPSFLVSFKTEWPRNTKYLYLRPLSSSSAFLSDQLPIINLSPMINLERIEDYYYHYDINTNDAIINTINNKAPLRVLSMPMSISVFINVLSTFPLLERIGLYIDTNLPFQVYKDLILDTINRYPSLRIILYGEEGPNGEEEESSPYIISLKLLHPNIKSRWD